MMETCPLCKPLPKKAKVYFDRPSFRIVRSAKTKGPMMVIKGHHADFANEDDAREAINYMSNAMFLCWPGYHGTIDFSDRFGFDHCNWHGVKLDKMKDEKKTQKVYSHYHLPKHTYTISQTEISHVWTIANGRNTATEATNRDRIFVKVRGEYIANKVFSPEETNLLEGHNEWDFKIEGKTIRIVAMNEPHGELWGKPPFADIYILLTPKGKKSVVKDPTAPTLFMGWFLGKNMAGPDITIIPRNKLKPMEFLNEYLRS